MDVGIVSIDKDGNVIKTPSYRGVPKHEKPIDTIINNVYNYRLSGCSFLLPASCIANVGGFREDIRTVSDVEYWYRLLFAGYEFYCLSEDVLVQNRSHGKQVGKTKVSLFEKELNELHISVAEQLAQIDIPNKLSLLRKLYYGVVVRRIDDAARHIKEKYLINQVSRIERMITLPFKTFLYKTKGTMINIARMIYRKIMVK